MEQSCGGNGNSKHKNISKDNTGSPTWWSNCKKDTDDEVHSSHCRSLRAVASRVASVHFVQWVEATPNMQLEEGAIDHVTSLKRRVWQETVKPFLLGRATELSNLNCINENKRGEEGADEEEGKAIIAAAKILSELFDMLFAVCCFLTYDHRMSFERIVGPSSHVKACVFGAVTPSLGTILGKHEQHHHTHLSAVASASAVAGSCLPFNTWTLQEGCKMLRKFVLIAIGSEIVQKENFALNKKTNNNANKKEKEEPSSSVITIDAEEAEVLEALLAILLYRYLPALVQQYPDREVCGGSHAERTEVEPKRAAESNSIDEGGDDKAENALLSSGPAVPPSHPTAVPGFPNVAICECSLAPTAQGEDETKGLNESDDEVTGLELVEGSLVVNPRLLVEDAESNTKKAGTAKSSNTHSRLSAFILEQSPHRSGREDQDDEYVLEPFSEIVRVPRAELFSMGTAKERCSWAKLLFLSASSSFAVGSDDSDDEIKSSISDRLLESIPDDEARLLLSFVFEAAKERTVETLLQQIISTANTQNNKHKTDGGTGDMEEGARQHCVVIDPRVAKTIAFKEKSSWSLLLSRIPKAFPTVPSFWPWSDLSFLYGTNVLDETTAKRARLDTVTDAIRFALFGNFEISSSSSASNGRKENDEEPKEKEMESFISEFFDSWDKKNSAEDSEEDDEEEENEDCSSSDSSSSCSSSSSSSASDDDDDSIADDPKSKKGSLKPTLTPQQQRQRLGTLATTSEPLLQSLFPSLFDFLFTSVESAVELDNNSTSNAGAIRKALLTRICPSFAAKINRVVGLPTALLTLERQMILAACLDLLVTSIFSSDNVQWARAVFDSRAFNLNLDGKVELVLAPVSDMINHSSRWSDILVRRVDHINGDMVMQLGAGITKDQLKAASSVYPHRELYMGYGPLQNWELLLSYGFALGDVVTVGHAEGEEKQEEEGSNLSKKPLALVKGNPFDRLPLPIDLQGLDEGSSAIDAAYSQRRREAIIRHGLNVGNGVWVGMKDSETFYFSEEEEQQEQPSGGNTPITVNSSHGEDAAKTSRHAVIFPAVVALMRLYHATVEEFSEVERNPFVPCPLTATEQQVWTSLRSTLVAVVSVVGSGCVVSEETEDVEETEEEDDPEEQHNTSESKVSEENGEEEEAYAGELAEALALVSTPSLKLSICKQLRRVIALKELIATCRDRTANTATHSINMDAHTSSNSDDDEEDALESAAASAVNEHLALLVSIPLRQIAVACLEYCDEVLDSAVLAKSAAAQ